MAKKTVGQIQDAALGGFKRALTSSGRTSLDDTMERSIKRLEKHKAQKQMRPSHEIVGGYSLKTIEHVEEARNKQVLKNTWKHSFLENCKEIFDKFINSEESYKKWRKEFDEAFEQQYENENCELLIAKIESYSSAFMTLHIERHYSEKKFRFKEGTKEVEEYDKEQIEIFACKVRHKDNAEKMRREYIRACHDLIGKAKIKNEFANIDEDIWD